MDFSQERRITSDEANVQLMWHAMAHMSQAPAMMLVKTAAFFPSCITSLARARASLKSQMCFHRLYIFSPCFSHAAFLRDRNSQ